MECCRKWRKHNIKMADKYTFEGNHTDNYYMQTSIYGTIFDFN